MVMCPLYRGRQRILTLAIAASVTSFATAAVAQESAPTPIPPIAPTSAATTTLDLRRAPLTPIKPDAVDAIRMSVERDNIPADGQTPAVVKVELFDARGVRVTEDAVISVVTSGGILSIPGARSDEAGIAPADADIIEPGVQMVAKGGTATFHLKAPIEAQTVELQVLAGTQSVIGKIHFVPAVRDLIAAGLVDGVIGFNRRNPLSLGQARPNDGFEDTINSWSRISGDGKRQAALRTAFFVKGRVFNDSLLTMTYDSDKPERDRLFRDLDPERWYPVYGDSSIVGFEARSSSRLYVRLDKGRNYLMYGDVVTGDGFSQRFGQGEVASTRVRDLGQYNRGFTGLRGHAENDRGFIDGFASYDNLRQVVEEFPGRGLSGPYTVSNSAYAVLGSERVERIVRDRYAPGRIVEVQTLNRFADYNFEPFSGRILFNQPVPSVDADLNPVSVRITYEVEQGGEHFWLYGANGQYRLAPNLEVGASAVKDENPLAPFELYSANATLNLGPKSYLRGEYAYTDSMAGSLGGNIYTLQPTMSGEHVSGDAWRLEFGHKAARNELFAWYGESDRNFNNPASSFLGGRKQGGLGGLWWFGRDAKRLALYGRGTWIEDDLTDASRKQAEAGLRWNVSQALTLEAGVNRVEEHAGDAVAGNGLAVPSQLTAPFGVGVVTPGFGGGFFGGSANSIMPGSGQTLYNTGSSWSGRYGSWVGNGLAGVPVEYTALRLGAQFRPSERLELNGEIEQDLSATEHRRAAVGASYRVHDRTRLYGRYEWNTGLSTVATDDSIVNPVTGARMPTPYQSDAFVFGLETEYMKDGSLFNEYRMYDSFGVRQSQIATGLRNQWRISPTLTMQTSAEHLQVLDGTGQESTAATVAADWRPTPLVFLSGRVEWRTTDAIDSGLPPANPATPGWMSEGYDSWLSTLSFGRKLSRDWTFLARNYYLLNDYAGSRPNSYENRFQIGFAYRDTDTNRFNVLTKYENWKRRDQVQRDWLPADLPFELSDGYDKQIFSLHADWHPNRVWWLSGHLAAKDQKDLFADRTDRFRAYLAGGRVTYALSERWDISGMGYRMWSPLDDTKQWAVGAEVGRMLTSNLWLSAGYNARGFDAPDMVGSEYTNQGAFIRLRFKFDENLFRGRNPEINRALPR